ncbi:MAG: ankyrin repeat domain-containing protein [Gammaproteobacteria bacterium]
MGSRYKEASIADPLKLSSMNRTFIPTLVILASLLIVQTSVLAESAEKARQAAFTGDLTQLKKALNSGVDVNSADSQGSTPLMLAASRGHISMVRELLVRGARVNATNSHGWTPLMLAAASDNTQIVRLLLSRGANREQKNANGQTAWDVAKSETVHGLLAPQVAKALEQPLAENKQAPKQDEAQSEVDWLLAAAQRSFEASQLTDAATSYQKVLTLAPGNAQAKAGIGNIISRYEQLARQSQAAGDPSNSLGYIDRGLEVAPGHGGLQALRADVRAALEKHERQRAEALEQERQERERTSQENEIERLFALAEQQVKTFKLTSPKGDNAYDTYRSVLSRDPGNHQALLGLERVASGYEQLVQQSQRKGDLQKSLRQIEGGLKVGPGHKGLLALRDQVRAEIAEAEQRRRPDEDHWEQLAETRRKQVEQVLANAARQVEAAKLTEPQTDNAYDSYRQVLALDPDNAQAKTGLEQIAIRLERLARGHREEGALKESLAAIEQGLKAAPGHAALQSLRSEVKAQIEEQEGFTFNPEIQTFERSSSPTGRAGAPRPGGAKAADRSPKATGRR